MQKLQNLQLVITKYEPSFYWELQQIELVKSREIHGELQLKIRRFSDNEMKSEAATYQPLLLVFQQNGWTIIARIARELLDR
jgi:hypothetical protein